MIIYSKSDNGNLVKIKFIDFISSILSGLIAAIINTAIIQSISISIMGFLSISIVVLVFLIFIIIRIDFSIVIKIILFIILFGIVLFSIIFGYKFIGNFISPIFSEKVFYQNSFLEIKNKELKNNQIIIDYKINQYEEVKKQELYMCFTKVVKDNGDERILYSYDKVIIKNDSGVVKFDYQKPNDLKNLSIIILNKPKVNDFIIMNTKKYNFYEELIFN